jgi:hypothetical protein
MRIRIQLITPDSRFGIIFDADPDPTPDVDRILAQKKPKPLKSAKIGSYSILWLDT